MLFKITTVVLVSFFLCFTFSLEKKFQEISEETIESILEKTVLLEASAEADMGIFFDKSIFCSEISFFSFLRVISRLTVRPVSFALLYIKYYETGPPFLFF